MLNEFEGEIDGALQEAKLDTVLFGFGKVFRAFDDWGDKVVWMHKLDIFDELQKGRTFNSSMSYAKILPLKVYENRMPVIFNKGRVKLKCWLVCLKDSDLVLLA